MECKFTKTKECPNTELFEKWKDNKRETAFLTLGICPECPVYREDIDSEERQRNE